MIQVVSKPLLCSTVIVMLINPGVYARKMAYRNIGLWHIICFEKPLIYAIYPLTNCVSGSHPFTPENFTSS